MKNFSKAINLLEELTSSPISFDMEGKGYDLLQFYFEGMSIDTLTPLLKSKNELIQKNAVWILSELGSEACSLLLPIIVSLLKSKNLKIKYYALECVMLGSLEHYPKYFMYIIKELNDVNEVIRLHSMRLISNANDLQLSFSIKNSEGLYSKFYKHEEGLKVLLKCYSIDVSKIYAMIKDEDCLVRKYGVIAASRIYKIDPNPIEFSTSSLDADIQKFSQEVIELNQY